MTQLMFLNADAEPAEEKNTVEKQERKNATFIHDARRNYKIMKIPGGINAMVGAPFRAR